VVHNGGVDHRPPQAAADTGPALWIAPRLSDRFGTVTRTVPAGFAAYARILHPADPGGTKQYRWSEVAEFNGRIMHPLVQYARISAPAPDRTALRPLADVQEPEAGNLEPGRLRSLCEVLAHYTTAPARCWFGVYGRNGGGQVISFGPGDPGPPPPQAPATWQLDPHAPEFELPHRVYSLFTGPLDNAVKIGRWVTSDWFLPHSPSLFWPDDRSWCAASEIDFDSTLVGGTAGLIAEILQCADLEAWPVGPDDSLAWDGDIINQP
jgi:hypothetical protein